MKKIIMLILVCFSFACDAGPDAKPTPDKAEPAEVKPAEKPNEKPEPIVEKPVVDLAEVDKKEAELTITKTNVDAEADKLLAEIEADLD